jgi:lipoprotein NlpD
LFACASPIIIKSEKPRGVYHTIKRGETLWSIARAYHADLQELAEINNITDPNSIFEGAVIFIPGVNHVVEIPMRTEQRLVKKDPAVSPEEKLVLPQEEHRSRIKITDITDLSKSPEQPTPETMKDISAVPSTAAVPGSSAATTPIVQRTDPSIEPKIEFERSRFIWPLRGTVTSKFGIQPNGLKYNGIRISAKEGSPVVASAAGEVTYAAPIKYYGETIILKHDSHYSTVYSFLNDIQVRVGDRVKKGDQIASLGIPVNGDGQSYLNFEIRLDNNPRNPLFFLP